MTLINELINSAALITEAYMIDFQYYNDKLKSVEKMKKKGLNTTQLENAMYRVASINRQRDRELQDTAYLIREARKEAEETRGYKSMYNEY